MIDDQITRAVPADLSVDAALPKQLELIVAAVIGAEINASVRFEIVGYEDAKPPYPRELVYIDAAADLSRNATCCRA